MGKNHVISTPDKWIYFKGQELGIEQQVMFANTSDWRFDVPGANHYVQWIDRACQGDLDETFYDNNSAVSKNYPILGGLRHRPNTTAPCPLQWSNTGPNSWVCPGAQSGPLI
ncbi:MAG: hypothetical protein Ct9H300mP11_15140 [Chloroflexota bacterium]|nr:MAG: hypothetical protein Ct9H300mP11_15140 [Chloroflexota bacterium]